MSDYPAPVVTWYAGDRCGTPLTGTTFANGACVGGQISIAGDRRETEINIAWPGAISASAWCSAVVGLRDGIATRDLLWPELADPHVAECRAQLEHAGL